MLYHIHFPIRKLLEKIQKRPIIECLLVAGFAFWSSNLTAIIVFKSTYDEVEMLCRLGWIYVLRSETKVKNMIIYVLLHTVKKVLLLPPHDFF